MPEIDDNGYLIQTEIELSDKPEDCYLASDEPEPEYDLFNFPLYDYD